MVAQKQQAFMKAYEACHDAFLRYCSALAYGKMDLEDLVQDVLLSTYKHFDKIEKKDQLLHYMIRAARNRSINIWRKARYKTQLLDQHTERLKAQGIAPEVLLDIQLLYKTIDQLPPYQKEALILFEINGFSIKEIAEIQNSSISAIKTRLSRGRQKLRHLMQEKASNRKKTAIFWLLLSPKAPKEFPKEISIWEEIRQLQPELPKEKVLDIIQQFPIGQFGATDWIANLVTNAPIVIPTGVAVAVGIFVQTINFSAPINDQIGQQLTTVEWGDEIKLENDFQTTEIIGQRINQPKSANQQPELREQQNSVIPALIKIASNNTNPFLAPTTQEDQRAPIPQLMSFRPVRQQALVSTGAEQHQQQPSNSFHQYGKAINLPANKEAFIATSLTSCDQPIKILVDKMRTLRKIAIRNLIDDKIIKHKKGDVKIWFSNKGIAVNRQLIPGTLQKKYQNLMDNYEIPACTERVVRITPTYIAVGEVTPTGFKGKVEGERVDINKLKKMTLPSLANDQSIDTKSPQVEERPIKPFHTLKVGGLAVVHLSEGPTTNAKVKVSGMPIEDLLTQQEDGVLTITTRGEHSGEAIEVSVSTPSLKAIEVEGAGELFGDNIKADQLDIGLFHPGAAWLGVEVTNQLNLYLHGGDLTIEGTAGSKKVKRLKDHELGTLRDKGLRTAQ